MIRSNGAFLEEFEDWGIETGRALALLAAEGLDDGDRYEAGWALLIESFRMHREMWTAVIGDFLRADCPSAAGRAFGFGRPEGPRGFAGILAEVTEGVGDGSVPTLTAAQTALLVGVATQWLADPERAPSPSEAAAAMRALGTGRPGRDGRPRSAHPRRRMIFPCDPLHRAAAERYDAELI